MDLYRRSQRVGPRRRLTLLIGVGVLTFLPRAHGQATPAPGASQTSHAEYGRIDTNVRQIRRPNCWTLVVRGQLRNPYDEPVDGLHLIVRLRTAGDKPRELERIDTELAMTIEPGQSVPFSRELTTSCTSTFNDVSMVAFARRRGAAELPTPAPEVEVEASRAEQSAAGPGAVPIVSSPVALP